MNTVIAYPKTLKQIDLLKEFLSKMKISFKERANTKKHDDSLMTKEEYFAMIDERIKAYERGESKLIKYTPELEKELFGSIL
ncbi:MAG: hypothetical protein LBR81_05160 [Prevotellaceae bacterium]|jgi:adenylate kinase family enzyme|nr:hypothetical protein [Prevotellaceae bacterium]